MKRTVYFLIMLGGLLLAAPAVAADHSESFLQTHHIWIQLGASIFNFAIFLAILVKFGKPAMQKYFDNNANEYQARMAEANKLLADIQDIHQQWKTRRDQLDEETARIQADAQRLVEAQANKILTNARQMAERLVADAEQTAISELALAKEDIRRELVAQLTDKAEDKIRARLTPSHQRMLIEEAIKKLEASS